MKIFKLNEDAQIPEFATEGSACFDLRICFQAGMKIKTINPHNKVIEIPVKMGQHGLQFNLSPQFRTMLPTGLIFKVPTGHVMKVYPRSGMSIKNGLTLANSTGVIDSDYTDEVFIPIYNMGDTPITVYHGDRMVQAMLQKTLTYTLDQAERRPSKKESRDGGFGSTGTA